MEAKNTLVFEVKKNDNLYRLEMPMNAPVGEAYSAAGDFLDKMISIINEQAEKRKAAEKSDSSEKGSKAL